MRENEHQETRNYLELGKEKKSQGNYLSAIDFYLKAIEDNYKNYQAYIELENTPTPETKIDELISFYYSIISQKLDLPFTWGNLADTLTRKGEIQEAIKCYQISCYKKAIEKNPTLATLDWHQTKEKPPDFIIIGATRCGTTSLYIYLQNHPQILSPNRKEIEFFTYNFEKGIDWYLAHFPALADRNDFLTGEATATYLYDLNAAQRLKQFCPNTKIIVLLRNPTNRALSWYYYKTQFGLEVRDLETAITEDYQELQSLKISQIYNLNTIISNNLLGGFYFPYLQSWLKLFPQQQFLLLKSEDFYDNTQTIMTKVFDFLGLPDCPNISYKAYNGAIYDTINPELINKLDRIYYQNNIALEKCLGWNFKQK